jgi:hypothetical protein
MAGSFEKDFGYLMPFLDKVASAVDDLPDPAARDELARMLGEEKQRWTRIQALLAGDKGVAPAPTPESPVADHSLPVSLTVGSLKRS